jgi:hypothetical protein
LSEIGGGAIGAIWQLVANLPTMTIRLRRQRLVQTFAFGRFDWHLALTYTQTKKAARNHLAAASSWAGTKPLKTAMLFDATMSGWIAAAPPIAFDLTQCSLRSGPTIAA